MDQKIGDPGGLGFRLRRLGLLQPILVQLLIDRNAAAGALVERTRASGLVVGTDTAMDFEGWGPRKVKGELEGAVLPPDALASLVRKSAGRVLTDDDAPKFSFSLTRDGDRLAMELVASTADDAEHAGAAIRAGHRPPDRAASATPGAAGGLRSLRPLVQTGRQSARCGKRLRDPAVEGLLAPVRP